MASGQTRRRTENSPSAHQRRHRQMVVNAEALRDHPKQVGNSRQPPERKRHAFGTPVGRHQGINQYESQRELKQVRQKRSGSFGAERGNHTDVRQPQQAGQRVRRCACVAMHSTFNRKILQMVSPGGSNRLANGCATHYRWAARSNRDPTSIRDSEVFFT